MPVPRSARTRRPGWGGRVTALFADGTLSFALPSGATLAELAQRLAAPRARRGSLLHVAVRLGS